MESESYLFEEIAKLFDQLLCHLLPSLRPLKFVYLLLFLFLHNIVPNPTSLSFETLNFLLKSSVYVKYWCLWKVCFLFVQFMDLSLVAFQFKNLSAYGYLLEVSIIYNLGWLIACFKTNLFLLQILWVGMVFQFLWLWMKATPL